MGKQWMIWILSGLLLLSGCVSRNVDTQSVAFQDISSDPNLENTASAPSEPVEKEVLQALAGSYFCEAQEVDKDYFPHLTLYENGDCEFSANLMTKMGTLYGSFFVQDNMLLMTVSGKDFTGYTADTVKSLRFDISGDNTLMYRGSQMDEEQVIGMTNPFDLFVRPKSNQEETSSQEKKTNEEQSYRITVKDNVSGKEGTLTSSDDWEKVEKITSAFAGRKPLTDTDDRITRRESNPSFSVTLQDGSHAEKNYVVFPGTPESLEKEVLICFDREEGQTWCSVEVLGLLQSLLEEPAS